MVVSVQCKEVIMKLIFNIFLFFNIIFYSINSFAENQVSGINPNDLDFIVKMDRIGNDPNNSRSRPDTVNAPKQLPRRLRIGDIILEKDNESKSVTYAAKGGIHVVSVLVS